MALLGRSDNDWKACVGVCGSVRRRYLLLEVFEGDIALARLAHAFGKRTDQIKQEQHGTGPKRSGSAHTLLTLKYLVLKELLGEY